MRPGELDALIEKGLEALGAARGLSGEEQAIVNRAIAKMKAAVCAECEHDAHEGSACTWRTADEYCDCGLAKDAPVPEAWDAAEAADHGVVDALA